MNKTILYLQIALVAIFAITATSCSNDANDIENEIGNSAFRIEGVIDNNQSTRLGYAGDENGVAKFKWTAGEFGLTEQTGDIMFLFEYNEGKNEYESWFGPEFIVTGVVNGIATFEANGLIDPSMEIEETKSYKGVVMSAKKFKSYGIPTELKKYVLPTELTQSGNSFSHLAEDVILSTVNSTLTFEKDKAPKFTFQADHALLTLTIDKNNLDTNVLDNNVSFDVTLNYKANGTEVAFSNKCSLGISGFFWNPNPDSGKFHLPIAGDNRELVSITIKITYQTQQGMQTKEVKLNVKKGSQEIINNKHYFGKISFEDEEVEIIDAIYGQIPSIGSGGSSEWKNN